MEEQARHAWRIYVLALLVLALGIAAVGCGDDDEESGSSDPATLTIEATSAEPPAYTAPGTAEAGVTEITLENNADAQIDGQLVRIEGEHSDDEVIGELRNAMRGQPVAEWFRGAGGAPSTNPGESSSVTQVLEPGTYYVVGGDAPPAGALTRITVDGEVGDAELPETDGAIVATEYEFTGENLTAGRQQIEMRNDGQEWHHFLGGQIKEDATIEEVRKFLETEKGPVPFADADDEGIGTAVFDGGISQVVEVDLKPGRYAFFCFIADRDGGPPHVAKGMVSEVTVEG